MNVPKWFFMHKEQPPNPYDVPGPLLIFSEAMSTRIPMTPLTGSEYPQHGYQLPPTLDAKPPLSTEVIVTLALGSPADVAVTVIGPAV